jgi:hypothetical protein
MTVASGDGIAWQSLRCAHVDLSGTGADPQPFTAACRLEPGHRPEQVYAVAAVTLECTNMAGCDTSPTAVPSRTANNAVAFSGGHALRFYSCWGQPCMSLTPQLWRAPVGTCQKHVVDVSLLDGTKAAGVNVDVRIKGPGKNPRFCKVPGATPRRAPDQGGGTAWGNGREAVIKDPDTGQNIHHIEAETDADGRVVFGVLSTVSSFDSIYDQLESGHTEVEAWIDSNDDDLFGEGDGDLYEGDLHWELPGRCTIVGTEGDDKIDIQAYPNKVCALGGNDVVEGLDGAEGHDVILGGPGDDILVGKRGNDKIWGGPGNDFIFGNDGDDRLFGGSGRDEIHGGTGVNRIDGGRGHDGCKNTAPKRKRDPVSPPPRACERTKLRKPPSGAPTE